MNREYETPKIEIIRFHSEDVMTESGGTETPIFPREQEGESDYPVFLDE